MSKPLFQAVENSGSVLRQTCSQTAVDIVNDDHSGLERTYVQLEEKLVEHLERCKSATSLFEETENGMEQLLDCLKAVRLKLAQPMPTSYDELEKALRDCRVNI